MSQPNKQMDKHIQTPKNQNASFRALLSIRLGISPRIHSQSSQSMFCFVMLKKNMYISSTTDCSMWKCVQLYLVISYIHLSSIYVTTSFLPCRVFNYTNIPNKIQNLSCKIISTFKRFINFQSFPTCNHLDTILETPLRIKVATPDQLVGLLQGLPGGWVLFSYVSKTWCLYDLFRTLDADEIDFNTKNWVLGMENE